MDKPNERLTARQAFNLPDPYFGLRLPDQLPLAESIMSADFLSMTLTIGDVRSGLAENINPMAADTSGAAADVPPNRHPPALIKHREKGMVGIL